MQRMLKITAVGETKKASDGRKFKTVKFQPKDYTPAGEEILSNDPERSRNLWEQGPPSEKGKTDFSKGDPLFHTARVGAIVAGSIHTGTVTPYEIPGNNGGMRNTATIVKFPGENLVRAFKNAGYELIDASTGEVLNQRAEVTAQAPVEQLVDAE